MARAKFLCDAERCIECNACVTACKNEHEVPWGINRRRVVTINDGSPGERSISVACMHCSDAPCMAVCPTDCFYQNEEGVVLHSKDRVLAAGIVFMPVRLARHSSHKLATSVAAARWTNARSVQGVLKKHTPLRSLQNMDATGLQRENFQSVRKCARRKLFLRVTVMSFPQYIANA